MRFPWQPPIPYQPPTPQAQQIIINEARLWQARWLRVARRAWKRGLWLSSDLTYSRANHGAKPHRWWVSAQTRRIGLFVAGYLLVIVFAYIGWRESMFLLLGIGGLAAWMVLLAMLFAHMRPESEDQDDDRPKRLSAIIIPRVVSLVWLGFLLWAIINYLRSLP